MLVSIPRRGDGRQDGEHFRLFNRVAALDFRSKGFLWGVEMEEVVPTLRCGTTPQHKRVGLSWRVVSFFFCVFFLKGHQTEQRKTSHPD